MKEENPYGIWTQFWWGFYDSDYSMRSFAHWAYFKRLTLEPIKVVEKFKIIS